MLDADLETRVAESCRAASLTPLQTEVLLLWLLDGLTLTQIRLKLHYKRIATVKVELEQALAKLTALPGFWEPARSFPKELVFCAADRRTYDERPPGMRGVTPSRASDRLHGGPLVRPDDRRLQQDVAAAARLWLNSLRSAD